MMATRKDVRILLVGDRGVGKTSLILSLVSEEFPTQVPARAEEITIPADVTPERVPTHIVDYSEVDQERAILVDELHRANVVCVVYAVDSEDSIERITTHWLPYLRETLGHDHTTPVILVGNKCDLLDISSMETILPIMYDYVEVETCVECSARTLKNISEMFYYAQKAVLHPTAPVYNAEEKELTEPCKRALVRIFKICDVDNDGLLNDDEINLFQHRCFNAPLQPQALEDVKLVVKRHIMDGIIQDSLSLKGFLFLHTLFIQRGRHETTWTVLRGFGYDDTLALTPDYLSPRIHVPLGSSTELSQLGYEFLSRTFARYDEDNDSCLSPTELQALFSTCPVMPWGADVNNTVSTNPQGWITRSGYLAQWTLTTLLDIEKAVELLAYLGYNYYHNSQVSAINVTREKQVDLQKRQTCRSVFQCQVIGSKSVGKTSFLQGLLGRNLRYLATLNKDNLSNYTINTIQVYGQEKYLLLHEVDVSLSDLLTPIEFVHTCDIACLLYDITNPSSFEFIANIYLRYLQESRVPTLIVACKSEHPAVRQNYELSPAEFCLRHSLPTQQYFSCIDSINREIYIKLATMAAYPNLRRMVHMLFVRPTPQWLQEKLRVGRAWLTSGLSLTKVSVGVAMLAGIGFVVYRLAHQST